MNEINKYLGLLSAKATLYIQNSYQSFFDVRVCAWIFIFSDWTSAACQRGAKLKWVSTFPHHKNGSDLPLSLHAKYTFNPASLSIPCKSFIQNRSRTLPGFDNSEGEGDWRNTIDASSHYSTHNDFSVLLFATRVVQVLKIHFRRSNSQKREVSRMFFTLKPRNIATLSLSSKTHRSKDKKAWWVISTDRLLWRQKNVFPRCHLTRYLPFGQKIWKFQFEVKWYGNCLEIPFRLCYYVYIQAPC